MIKSFEYTVVFVFLISTSVKCLAGQISVINPSSGSEASGVVMISPEVSSTNFSSIDISINSGVSGTFDVNSTNKTVNVRQYKIMQYLNSIQVENFSAADRKILLSYIDHLMGSSKISDSSQKILIEQYERLDF